MYLVKSIMFRKFLVIEFDINMCNDWFLLFGYLKFYISLYMLLLL